MITVRVASDFSRHPAGRFLGDGPYSGEAFRKKFLEPNLNGSEQLTIELDGARGYGSSFLEEAFGGLVRLGFDRAELLSKIFLVASNSSLKKEIVEYIENAQPQ
jgi:hypothetical protein